MIMGLEQFIDEVGVKQSVILLPAEVQTEKEQGLCLERMSRSRVYSLTHYTAENNSPGKGTLSSETDSLLCRLHSPTKTQGM